MSLLSPQELTLDFTLTEVKTVFVNQNDSNSRIIEISFTDNGEPVEIDSSLYTAVFKLYTHEKTAFLDSDCCVIQDDGTVLLTLSDSMVYDAGRAAAQILFTNTTDETSVSTVSFWIIVHSEVYNSSDYLEDYANYELLNELLLELENMSGDSETYATLSESWAIGGTGTRDDEDTNNSMYYSELSSTYATNSETSATNSETSATNAATSETNAATSETNAETYMNDAHGWADNQGDSGTDEYSSTNNAYYYYTICKSLVDSLGAVLHPMGSCAFADLPEPITSGDSSNVGYLYNITDDFTTTSMFIEGEGIEYKAGAEVYITADGYYSVMVGANVTGIKGEAETSYRVGQVEITKENLGLSMTIDGTTLVLTT